MPPWCRGHPCRWVFPRITELVPHLGIGISDSVLWYAGSADDVWLPVALRGFLLAGRFAAGPLCTAPLSQPSSRSLGVCGDGVPSRVVPPAPLAWLAWRPTPRLGGPSHVPSGSPAAAWFPLLLCVAAELPTFSLHRLCGSCGLPTLVTIVILWGCFRPTPVPSPLQPGYYFVFVCCACTLTCHRRKPMIPARVLHSLRSSTALARASRLPRRPVCLRGGLTQFTCRDSLLLLLC